MKVEARIFFGSGLFLGISGIIYWFWSREQAGTVWFVFGTAACFLVASFLRIQQHRRMGIPRPEDNPYAEQSDGAGEVGFFPAASIWPPAMGVGAVFIAVGTIYGMWYWVIGGLFMLGGIIGFAVEAEAREEGPDDPGMPLDPGNGHTPITSESVPSAYKH